VAKFAVEGSNVVGYFVADQTHALDPVDAAQRGLVDVPGARRRAFWRRIEVGLGTYDDDKVGFVDQVGGELKWAGGR
jgi:hypothetical protein